MNKPLNLRPVSVLFFIFVAFALYPKANANIPVGEAKMLQAKKDANANLIKNNNAAVQQARYVTNVDQVSKEQLRTNGFLNRVLSVFSKNRERTADEMLSQFKFTDLPGSYQSAISYVLAMKALGCLGDNGAVQWKRNDEIERLAKVYGATSEVAQKLYLLQPNWMICSILRILCRVRRV